MESFSSRLKQKGFILPPSIHKEMEAASVENGVDKPTRLIQFVTFVHLPFSVRSLNLFVASLVFMEGTSCFVIRPCYGKFLEA